MLYYISITASCYCLVSCGWSMVLTAVPLLYWITCKSTNQAVIQRGNVSHHSIFSVIQCICQILQEQQYMLEVPTFSDPMLFWCVVSTIFIHKWSNTAFGKPRWFSTLAFWWNTFIIPCKLQMLLLCRNLIQCHVMIFCFDRIGCTFSIVFWKSIIIFH